MSKRLVVWGLVLASVVAMMFSVGVASAGGSGHAKGADWREVNATLQLDPLYVPGGEDWITPLGKKSAVSLAQYQNPWTDSLEGRFRVLSIFYGGMHGLFGDGSPMLGIVTTNITSTLNVNLDPAGGTEKGIIKGESSVDFVDFSVQMDGGNAIYGKIIGQADLIMGPVPPPEFGYPLHPLAGGDVKLVFVVTGGSGDWEGANGILKINGDPVAGATVNGQIKVGRSVHTGP